MSLATRRRRRPNEEDTGSRNYEVFNATSSSAVLERQKPVVDRHGKALEQYLAHEGGSPVRAREEKYAGITPGGRRRYVDQKYAERRRRYYEFDVACLEEGVEGEEGVAAAEGVLVSPIRTKHEWKAEFEGDVGAFSYPSLQEEIGRPSDFLVKWKLEDTVLPAEEKADDEDKETFEQKGEKCLRSRKSAKAVSAHRVNASNSLKEKDIADSAPEWHYETKGVYEKLADKSKGRVSVSAGEKAMERAYEKLLKLDLDAKMDIMLAGSPTIQQHVSLSPAIEHYRRKKMRRDMVLEKVHIFLGISPSGSSPKMNNSEKMRQKLRDAEYKVVQQLEEQKNSLKPIAETRDRFFGAYNSTRRSNEEDFGKFREIYQGDGVPQETLANAKFVEECLKRGIAPEPLVFHRHEGNTTLRLTNYSMGDDLGAAFACSLPHLPPMHHLDLAGNRLTGKSVGLIIAALARTHGRRDSNGEVVANGEGGAGEMVVNTHPLQSLNLSNNKLEGACIMDLRQMIVGKTNHLSELNLSHTHLSDISIGHLARSIDDGTTLKRLDLSNNNITSKGGTDFARVLVSGRSKCSQCIKCSRSIHCVACSDLLLSLCALGSHLPSYIRWIPSTRQAAVVEGGQLDVTAEHVLS
jgi:hypothetical protein